MGRISGSAVKRPEKAHRARGWHSGKQGGLLRAGPKSRGSTLDRLRSGQPLTERHGTHYPVRGQDETDCPLWLTPSAGMPERRGRAPKSGVIFPVCLGFLESPEFPIYSFTR